MEASQMVKTEMPAHDFLDKEDYSDVDETSPGLVTINFYCRPCNSYFSSCAEFELHNHVNHSKRDKLTCPHCKVVFKRFDHLRRHIQIHVIRDFCQCPICDKDFKKRELLTEHFNLDHPDIKTLCCKKCPFRCEAPVEFHKHDQSHFTTKHVCFHCNKMFRRRDHLTRHQQTQHSNDTEKCVICSKDFKRRDHLKRHIREKHGKNLINGCLFEFDQCLNHTDENSYAQHCHMQVTQVRSISNF